MRKRHSQPRNTPSRPAFSMLPLVFFGGEIEIIPWKVRTNVFYSQVAHRNASWIKPLKHFPWYDVFILYTLRFFSRPTHFKVWKPFKVIPLKWNLPWDFSTDCCSWLQSVGMIEKAGRRQVRSGSISQVLCLYVILNNYWVRFCDIQKNQGRGKGYQPKPKHVTKTESNCFIIHWTKKNGSHVFGSSLTWSNTKRANLTWLPVTLSASLDMIIV